VLREENASRFLLVESNRPTVIQRSSEFLSLKKTGKRTWPTKWLLLNYSKAKPSENSKSSRSFESRESSSGSEDGLQCGGLRFGVTASRKVGSAVVRNKLKRWVREYLREFASRSNQTGSSFEVTINIIFKPIDQGFYKGLKFEEFRKAMDIGLETLRKAS
jgi:ribonuclease P protein component